LTGGEPPRGLDEDFLLAGGQGFQMSAFFSKG
jgi:hypothetical protein